MVVEGKKVDEDNLRCLCSRRKEEGRRTKVWGQVNFHEGQRKRNPQRRLRRASQRGKRKTRKISIVSPKVGVAMGMQATENK